jgi:hypothetical protein
VTNITEQCSATGDLHHALAAGVMSRAEVHAELGEIIAGRKPGRTNVDEIIVFDSTGHGAPGRRGGRSCLSAGTRARRGHPSFMQCLNFMEESMPNQLTHPMRPFAWAFPYPSQRMPILARNAVATSQPLAAQAGLSMLYKGGNAVDAVLATAITLTVVEPTGSGIGSDAFAILWDGSKLHGLNASGRSPEGWTLDRFKGKTTMPTKGWDAVTVPGAVSAWVALSERFGKLPSRKQRARRFTEASSRKAWPRIPASMAGR